MGAPGTAAGGADQVTSPTTQSLRAKGAKCRNLCTLAFTGCRSSTAHHGVTWLENRGTFPFAERRLSDLPGVHRAPAADLDGDGDLDIVVCALLPSTAAVTAELPSVVWLEQVKSGAFARHMLEKGFSRHATLDARDFDGDVDLAVGNFRFSGTASGEVQVWESMRLRGGQAGTRIDVGRAP